MPSTAVSAENSLATRQLIKTADPAGDPAIHLEPGNLCKLLVSKLESQEKSGYNTHSHTKMLHSFAFSFSRKEV